MNFQDTRKYSGAYSALSKYRTIVLSEDLTKETAATLCSLLIYYNSLSVDEEIKILINTNGGDASALLGIYDTMSMIQAPISTIGLGRIYSAGVFILAAGTKGKRAMMPNSEVMIHGVQCSFPSTPLADQVDSTNYFSYLEKFNMKIMKILSNHTNQSLQKISQDSKRDLYLNPKEAKKYGIVDHVL